MNRKSILLSVLVIWALIMSCNLPSAQPIANAVTEVPSLAPANEAQPATPTFTAITPLTETATVIVPSATTVPSATACTPIVVANSAVNVRSGPGTVYEIISFLNQGQSAKLAGKSMDGTWWYIEHPSPGAHGWVGGTVVTASCVPVDLMVVAAPPTPIPPTATKTNVPAPLFAVTSVTYSVSTWSDAGHTNCPRITANITVSSAGSVTYKWTRSDGAGGTGGTLVFAAAGTQSVTADWALGSVWAPAPNEWMGIYIDTPNHQDFGHANMPACTAP